MRTGISFEVAPTDRVRLKVIVGNRNSPQKHVWRAEIVLFSGDGLGTMEIMRRTGKSKPCVWRWQERFMQMGVEGLLHDKTRPSRTPALGEDVAERVVALTLKDPPHEATHWTAPAMARTVGVSESSVRRIWRAHGLAPHRFRRFKLSNDPDFVTKLRDVVGLYVDPPAHAHAVVLSVDEKSQIQALDRTQPGLPLKKGRAGKAIHAILDNYAVHKHPKVRAWPTRHPRWVFHFVPTSCSWLNAVEGFFAKLAKRRLKRGVFNSIVDLQAAINRFLNEHNGTEAKPFQWTADPDRIIAAVKRGHQVLDSDH